MVREQGMVGEILEKRYVVLELVGADGDGQRYVVYDMQGLKRLQLRVSDAGITVVGDEPPAPPAQAVPPPTPPTPPRLPSAPPAPLRPATKSTAPLPTTPQPPAAPPTGQRQPLPEHAKKRPSGAIKRARPPSAPVAKRARPPSAPVAKRAPLPQANRSTGPQPRPPSAARLTSPTPETPVKPPPAAVTPPADLVPPAIVAPPPSGPGSVEPAPPPAPASGPAAVKPAPPTVAPRAPASVEPAPPPMPPSGPAAVKPAPSAVETVGVESSKPRRRDNTAPLGSRSQEQPALVLLKTADPTPKPAGPDAGRARPRLEIVKTPEGAPAAAPRPTPPARTSAAGPTPDPAPTPSARPVIEPVHHPRAENTEPLALNDIEELRVARPVLDDQRPPRARIQTKQIEAAWFAEGEELEEEAPEEQDWPEDRRQRQHALREQAAQLTTEKYKRYALELSPPDPPSKMLISDALSFASGHRPSAGSAPARAQPHCSSPVRTPSEPALDPDTALQSPASQARFFFYGLLAGLAAGLAIGFRFLSS